jgi:hypothetical protein
MKSPSSHPLSARERVGRGQSVSILTEFVCSCRGEHYTPSTQDLRLLNKKKKQSPLRGLLLHV